MREPIVRLRKTSSPPRESFAAANAAIYPMPLRRMLGHPHGIGCELQFRSLLETAAPKGRARLPNRER